MKPIAVFLLALIFSPTLLFAETLTGKVLMESGEKSEISATINSVNEELSLAVFEGDGVLITDGVSRSAVIKRFELKERTLEEWNFTMELSYEQYHDLYELKVEEVVDPLLLVFRGMTLPIKKFHKTMRQTKEGAIVPHYRLIDKGTVELRVSH